MPIALDLVLATRPNASTGIERYAINLFDALRGIAHDTIAFVDERSTVLNGDGLVPVKGGFAGWLALPSTKQYRKQLFDTLVCPAFPPSPLALLNKTPVARIIHDDFPWTRSNAMNFRGRFLFRDLETRMASRYKSIFAPTDLMAHSLSDILRRDVVPIGNAPGIDLGAAPPADRAKQQLIAVGTIEPRKNYNTILALEPYLPADWSLAIVGRNGWGPVAANWEKHLAERGGTLEWHGHASDQTLLALYQTSKCFISMSLAEGFNMPLVEAGSLGLAVVCSDIEIHRTVAPPWASFVPLSISSEDLANVVLQASNNLPAKAAVAAYSEQFSWIAIAKRLLRQVSQ
ncbi:hypothetical protein HMP09_2648 [Sphingomonas sp. HMP9]|nr:hypothetical protein HMP09_2648 [Sphingomonas sp. HMP9]